MLGYKLEKDIKLYKNQFETFCLDLFHSHRIDRLSLDIDGLLFRLKYMARKNKDLDKIDDIKSDFEDKALELRRLFASVIYEFLIKFVTIPAPFKLDDIEDVLAQDVNMNTTYVTFKMVLISPNKNFLEYIDNSIPDNDVYNIFPNQYFRFFTDSYNDGISKAYPELFENRQQDKIGVGEDADVFVHNLTFQTSEACSLNCTYCFSGDSLVTMGDGSRKPINDIEVGDMVMACPESITEDFNNETFYNPDNYVPTRVTHIFKREAETVEVSWKECCESFRVTKDHPFLSCSREWLAIDDIFSIADHDHEFVYYDGDNYVTSVDCFELNYDETPKVETVYNLETELHTFIVSGLVCHNCYQFNKSPMKMSFDTAKMFIDKLLNDEYGYINRYNSPAIIIEFIGGEPLLEIDLTRKIYEYFLDQCYELNHPWFTMHRLSICSNGLQYFDPEVQEFFKLYSSQISFNISIDGNKELHDACRIQPNGEGSYDIDITALNHYNKHYAAERNSKMTLAPSNISHLCESVIDFINHDMKSINVNCVFEEGWTPETARIEYYQLKELADYIIDNSLENIFISIFRERQEDKNDINMDSNACGGSGSMLSIRPNGQFYPCIRYMPTSVGNDVRDLCLGTVRSGLKGRSEGSDILEEMDRNTRRGQTNDICFNCPIGNSCAACSALGQTVFGNFAKKTTFHCIQVIAEALANVYYWNRLVLKHPDYDLNVRINNVPDEWARIVIPKEELDELKLLECAAIAKKMDDAILPENNNS